MGYHIYPAELKVLKDAVKSAASHTYSCAAAPIQYAVAKVIRHTHTHTHTHTIWCNVIIYCIISDLYKIRI